MGRQKALNSQEQSQSASGPRPKRRATNAHILRYLQTRNPSRLEGKDLKKALEVSLEECPDFWPEDTASCSSSDQSNATSSSTEQANNCRTNKRKSKSATSTQRNHLNHQNSCYYHNHNYPHHGHPSFHANSQCTAINHCCPKFSVQKRYKPVAKKNIYSEADFFHDGIMEYIEYELEKHAWPEKKRAQAEATKSLIKIESNVQ